MIKGYSAWKQRVYTHHKYRRLGVLDVFLTLQVFFMLIISLPSMYMNYIPTPNYNRIAVIFILMYGFVCGVTLTYLKFKYPAPEASLMPKKLRVVGILILPVFVTFFTAIAVLEGGPYLLGHFFSEEGSYTYTVERSRLGRSISSRRIRYCGQFIIIKEVGILGVDHICHVPSNLWMTLQPGERITITGSKTVFGIVPSTIKRAAN